jgi:ATP-dependent DNA helicase RecG
VVKNVVKTLDAIRADPGITRAHLAKEVGLTVRGVERNLALLKKQGRLRRIGGNKGGLWEVLD